MKRIEQIRRGCRPLATRPVRLVGLVAASWRQTAYLARLAISLCGVAATAQAGVTAKADAVTVNLTPPIAMNGLALWLDASQLGGLSDGQQLDTWTDMSGQNNHAIRQGASSLGYPKYLASGLNGKPVVRFNSQNADAGDYLKFNRIATIRSVFWVVKENPGLGIDPFLLGDDSSYDFNRASINGPLWHGYWANPSILNGTTKLMGTAVDGTSTSLPAGTFQLISLVTTGNVQANQITQDRSYHGSWVGDIAEIVIYTRALSTAEEGLVGSYLAAKYGLATNYPPLNPTVPSGLRAVGGDAKVYLTWTAFPGATGYKVKRSPSSGGSYSVIGTPSGTSLTDTPVTNGTTFFYVVSAMTGTVESGNSAEVGATPTPVNGATSTVTASLPSLWADGFDFSTITVTLNNAGGTPIAGKTVTLASSRGLGMDTIAGSPGTTDASGVVTFAVKSSTVGAAAFTATDTTDGLVLTPAIPVTFVPLPTPVTTYLPNTSVLQTWDFHNSAAAGWGIYRNVSLTDAGVKLGAPIPGNPDPGTWVGMMIHAAPAGLSYVNSGVEMKYNAADGPPPTSGFEFLAMWHDAPRTGFTVGAGSLAGPGNTAEQGGTTVTWPVPAINGGLAGPHTLALVRRANRNVETYLDGVKVSTFTSADPTTTLEYISVGFNVIPNMYMPLGSVVSQVRAFNVAADSSAKDILTFGLPGNPAGITGSNIVMTVPYGTNVTALAPTYTVSPLATGAPASGTVRNFTTPQSYVITANDGSSKNFAVTLIVTQPPGMISMDFVSVGNPGNPPDTGGLGAVGHTYQIGKYEVTNSQYTAFLNAADAGGTNANGISNGIYNASMGSDPHGGISFTSGAPNGAKYAVRSNMGNKPVNFVSWYDAARFVNWLHNGQGSGRTETGAYTLAGNTGLPTKNAAATVWIPSENEWYKAAHYDPASSRYWLYGTRSNAVPTLATANATGDTSNPGANVANHTQGAVWNGQMGNVTTVGSAGAASAYGTNDQSGNVWEWNDFLNAGSVTYPRHLRGGGWDDPETGMRSSFAWGALPSVEVYDAGFRVASSPEFNLTNYSAAVIALDPVGYWRLNETTSPAVNLGHLGAAANGTYGAGTFPGTPGPWPMPGLGSNNSACRFDGTGQIACGNANGLNIDQLSIAAWIKTDGIMQYMNVLAKGGLLWRLNINANSNQLIWTCPGGGAIGTRNVADGAWHHVVAVAGSAGSALYVNGQLNATGPAISNIPDNTDPVTIGSQGDPGLYRWKGSLDEVALFDTALTAQQVAALYLAAEPPAADILTFGPGALINATSINWTAPHGLNVKALAPVFTLAPGSSCDHVSGTPYDFSSPVIFKVTASDLTTKTYTVTATVEPQPATLASTFNLGTSGNGTFFEGGSYHSWIAKGVLPAGSFLRSLAIEATLESTDNSNWAAELMVVCDPTPGTPGGDGLLEIGPDYINLGSAQRAFWTNGLTGPVSTVTGTMTAGVDFSTAIDLSSVGLFVVNGYGGPVTGGTWSGTVTVTYEVASQSAILSFGLPGIPGVIDQAAKSITLNVPQGTNVTALAPTYTVTPFATGIPVSGTARNFTTPQTYVITGQDGSITTYTVKVTAGSGLLVKTYDTTYGIDYLDPIANLMAVTPSGTSTQVGDLDYVSPAASLPGLTNAETFAILWEGWFDVSKDGPGVYTFGTNSDDGSVVYLDLNGDGDFADPGEMIVGSDFNHTIWARTGTVTLNMDSLRIAIGYYQYSDSSAMAAGFKKGSGFEYAELDPINGTSGHFFTAQPPVSPAAASVWNFGLPGYPALINGTNIAWSLPPGTNVTALAPTFTISSGASAVPSSGVVRNFTTPQNYSVTAKDGSVKNYTVTVKVSVSDGLMVKTFDNTYGAYCLDPISNLMALTPSGTFKQFGTVEVTPGNTAGSFPGLTANDTFAILWEGWLDVSKDGPGAYTFGAESDDGSVIYLDLNGDGDFTDAGERIVNNNSDHVPVILTNSVVLDRDAVRIAIGYYENSLLQTFTPRFKKGTGLAFSALDPITGSSGHFFSSVPPVNPAAANLWDCGLPGNPAVMSETNIVLTVPYGTNVTALAPTFTISSGASAVPLSGSVRNFATPQTYTVSSANQLTTKVYAVTVLITPTWIRDASGLWSTSANWGGGNVANGSGTTADFGTIDLTADRTVSLDSPRTIGYLTFGDTATASAAGWTLSNNGAAANILTLAGGMPAITVNTLGSGKSATIGAQLVGTLGLTKFGAGTLTLTNTNTYSGGTMIQAGVLQVGNGGLGGSLGYGTVTNNATLVINRTGALALADAITGTGGVVKLGAGTLSLDAANTFAGGMRIEQGTVLLKGGGWYAGNASGSGPVTVKPGATLVNWNVHSYGGGNAPSNDLLLEQGKFQLNTETYFGDLTMTAGIVELYPGTLTGGDLRTTQAAGGSVITTLPASSPSEIRCMWSLYASAAANISDGPADPDLLISGIVAGPGNLAKFGPGTLHLAASNTYTGLTTVSAGTLALSGNNSAATGGITVAGGVVQFNSLASINGTARNVTVNPAGAVAFGPSFGTANIPAALNRIVSSSVGGIAADNYAAANFNFSTAGLTTASLGALGNVSYTGTLTPNGTTYRLGGGSGTLTVTSPLSGAGRTLVVNGNVILRAASTFTGSTTINSAKTLQLGTGVAGQNGSLASPEIFNSGSLVWINFDNQAYAGVVSGNGSLTKTGSGQLTLLAPQAYTGLTTVSGGTLSLGAGDHTLAANRSLLVSSGTLDLGRSSQYVGSFSGSGGTITGSGGRFTLNPTTAASFAGAIQGSLNLVKIGVGNKTLTLTSDNTTTGTICLLGGDTPQTLPASFNGLRLIDGGRLSGAAALILNNASLFIDNSGTTNDNNRINDAAPVSLNGGRIVYTGRPATSAVETFGNVTLNSGLSTLTVTPGTAGSAGVTLGSLTRNTGATLRIDGTNLGTPGNAGRIIVAAPLSGNLAMVNGIIPGVIAGGLGTTNQNLVTYDAGFGFQVAANFSTQASLADVGATENVDWGSTTTRQVKSGGQTINSVSAYTGSGGAITFDPATGASDVLVLGSGMYVQGSNSNFGIGTAAVRGKLTSGLASGELFLIKCNEGSSGGGVAGNIHSVITDHGATRVKLILASSNRTDLVDQDATLTANNTHTGGTHVAGGNRVYLAATSPGDTPIPPANDPTQGLVIDNSDVIMLNTPQQIAATNIVTLNGGSTLTLVGSSNVLAGLVINSHGGKSTPGVSGGGKLTLSGNIACTPSDPSVIALIGVALDLNGTAAHDLTVAALPEGNFVNPLTPLLGLTISSVIQNGGFTKMGTGVLNLTAVNTFAGQLAVEEGVVNVASVNHSGASGVLGNSTNPVILGKFGGGTGTLEYTGGSIASTKRFRLAEGGSGAFQVDAIAANLTLSGLIDGGGALTKTGGGTLTLSAANAYSGNTTVAGGTLVLADNAALKFVVTNASANRLTGTGVAILNGDFTIDTSAVTATAGSWNLVDVASLNESFGATFTIMGAGWSERSNIWTRIDGTSIWTFTESTGMLGLTQPNLTALDLSVGTMVPGFEILTTTYLATVPYITDSVTVTPVTEQATASVQVNGVAVASGKASGVIHLTVGNNLISTLVTAENGITTKTYTIRITRLPENFVLNSASDVPVTADGFSAGGYPVTVMLNYPPTPGTVLTLVNNTGLGFIHGVFANLTQGQRLTLTHGGIGYDFVINYFGGTGNDLVLQWANTKVVAWGSNSYGQLGDHSTTHRLLPTSVDDTGVLAGKTILAVAGGYLNSLALCSDGTLAAWGYNVYGQLGNNGTAPSNVPVAVERSGVLAGKTLVGIAAGPFHNLALCSDGTVVAWGYNNYGQLGTGDTQTRHLPVRVLPTGSLAGKQVVAVAAAAYGSFALCADGTLAAWGYNEDGELGDGSMANSLTPVAVDRSGVLAGKQISSLSAGQYHTLALCTDGTLIAWGYNNRGQLGNGSTESSNVPMALGSLGSLAGKTVVTTRASGGHSLALCADGTLAAWGWNKCGQLGVTGVTQSSIPVASAMTGVSANTHPTQIALGGNHSLVLSTDGSLAAWGDNANGQLGNNSTIPSAVPVAVDRSGLDAGARGMMVASGCAALHNLAVVGLASVSVTPRQAQLQSWIVMDSDHDGDCDLVEYAFGLHLAANNGGQLPQSQRIGDNFVMRFTQPSGVSGVTFGAEWSSTLLPGSWAEVPDTGTGEEHIFSVPADAGRQGFLRLKVTAP